MDDLFKNLPEIIKASASSPLGIVALMIIALSILAFVFFKGASEKARIAIFVLLFAGVAALAAVILKQSKIVSERIANAAEVDTDAESRHNAPADGTTKAIVSDRKYPLTLDVPADTFKAGPGSYKVLAATVDRSSDDELSLDFKILYTRGADAFAGGTFMAENFRLIVGDVPLAPIQAPNEAVDVNSAKQGLVSFSIPMATKTAVLQVGQPSRGTTTIPIDLGAVK